MIARLQGTLVETEGGRIVVDVCGIGYEVLVPDSVLVQLPPIGQMVELRIRQVFREDGTYLYGFLEPFQRRLFDLVTEVKGCGPKIALALIGTLGEDNVASAITREDARVLARAPGVGLKLAERMVLELRDKIQSETLEQKAAGKNLEKPMQVEDELIDALQGLGYRRQEAEVAAEKARNEAEGLQEQLVAALRILKK